MLGFVDLHAHFLPAIDDGAPTAAIGASMVRGLHALGFSLLHATPHQRAGMFMPDDASIQAARKALDQALATPDSAAQGPEIRLGAENYWDDVLAARLGCGEVPSYHGGPAFLFELPTSVMPARLEENLFRIRIAGRLPVLAHPERYAAVQEDLARAKALGKSAALVVDLGALDGAFGKTAMKTARALVEQDLVHAVASDVHTVEDLRAVAAGMTWIRKRLGEAVLARLLTENPHRILRGELP